MELPINEIEIGERRGRPRKVGNGPQLQGKVKAPGRRRPPRLRAGAFLHVSRIMIRTLTGLLLTD